MNIGIVTTWYERGAAYVSRAYRGALTGEHEVFIYARGGEKPKGNPKWDQPYVTWDKPVPEKPYMYIDPTQLERWVRQNNLQVVMFNEQHNWETVLNALKIDEIAIGAYVDYYRPETVPFFELYDFLLCNTKRHYEVFKNHPQAFYIPWGANLKLFELKDKKKERDELVFFHSCGWGSKRKGTDILVNAFQQVKGNTKLIIHAQRAVDNFPSIESVVVRDLRIDWVVAHAGPPGLYHLGDVYVYPTRLEGIGLTIAEALASGLPVVTTNEPPMSEFVAHGVSGRLVEVETYQRRDDYYYWPESVCNQKAVAEAMQFYVENRKDIEKYRRQARQYAEKHLSWENNAQNLPMFVKKISRSRENIDHDLIKRVQDYEHAEYFHRKIIERFKYLKHVLSKQGVKRPQLLATYLLANFLSRLVGK